MLRLQIGALQVMETTLQYIVTVPAIWGEIAKETTLAAAEAAGLGDETPILMVSEPVS